MPTHSPTKATLQAAILPSLILLLVLFMLTGCEMGLAMFLGARDREIKESTHAVESARNDVARAKAYSTRAVAYSEKARYSREFKLIRANEYERLLSLAHKDHDEAVKLNPDSSEMYFNRGQTITIAAVWI